MAAPLPDAGEFETWLNERLDSLEVDREVYGAYILGILQEEENDEEKEDALRGILSAFLEEDAMEDVCK
uniref:Coiled-coil domain-containing protein 43 n=2 Tax=Oryzias melastigma TaxID=30732 RepID=A0A3B3DAE2_ORYME